MNAIVSPANQPQVEPLVCADYSTSIQLGRSGQHMETSENGSERDREPDHVLIGNKRRMCQVGLAMALQPCMICS